MPKTRIDTPTRERILRTARRLFQQRGYYAVGTAEILADACAPKGSMYHHFPDGKEQIAISMVEAIRFDVLTLLQKFATDGLSVADSFRELSKGMARWLRDSAYREGTLLATTSVGAVPDMPKLHAEIRKAFDEWRGHVVQRLSRDGFTRSASTALANTMIAGLEGAMILARIHQDEHIVVTTAETLARLIESSPRYSAGARRRTLGRG